MTLEQLRTEYRREHRLVCNDCHKPGQDCKCPHATVLVSPNPTSEPPKYKLLGRIPRPAPLLS